MLMLMMVMVMTGVPALRPVVDQRSRNYRVNSADGVVGATPSCSC